MSNYHKYLTKLGYLIKMDELEKKTLEEIKKELTFKPIVYQAFKSISKPNTFLTYEKSPSYLFVPRFYGINKLGAPNKNLIPKGAEMNASCQISSLYGVRPHQENAYRRTHDQLVNNGGGILSVFCGWGKTFMAIYLAVKLHGKTLVLVHKEDLFDQWRSEILYFTNGTASIGCIQQNKIDVEGHDIVLAMLPSLSKRDYPPEIFNTFRLLIVDECHHIGSEIFSRALHKTVFRYTLGLSATPFRKDGLTTVFTNFLGPIFHIEKRDGRLDTLVLRLQLESSSCYYEDQFFVNGTKNTAKMVLSLVDFPERNGLIVQMLRKLYLNTSTPEKRKTLILSKSRRHLTVIYNLLKEMSLKWEEEPVTYGYYWGRSPNGENGLAELCLAPIPEIIKKNSTLTFKVGKKQPCIFNRVEADKYCLFHQYLNEYGEGADDFDDYTLCQKQECYNYFKGGGDLCNICLGLYSPNSEINLSESIKSAKIKKSSKIKHREMLEHSKTCDIILGTNDIASEALNIPGLNTLIQATPQQEVEQTVGRILRKQSVDAKNPPLIIDLIDKCGNFVNHSRVRLKTYKNEGFRVINLSKLDLDDKPFEKFNWTLFENHIKSHSFGEEQIDNSCSEDEEDEPEKKMVECLI